ncbi:LacI family transcriptional regulator [Vibrio sp. UCD-FRSSP16_10]|uniref:LacI family DNA-binding transcriptional regulator n=1 Tax=unclassified Vibrio TaxID=2614977 RepID=UPI0007FC3C26|nr:MULTISPECIES: LacI family DNA-binding transcriptional regulator [unclassified Vibrio]OBT13999.1 LacI family transcriptional regulator [Vibrio sp. UCD-FRSSP16_30]OBT22880.1 LacI family transcriptional regulator [Vibrio sp. UCD-FRSSP16_10]
MKKTRIIDVATHAGVSKSTVSQFLNGRFGHMSAQTKIKIEAAVKELNYVPNPIARSLKVVKTKTIGVVVRDITGFYTSRVMRGIDDYCKQHNYNVMIYNSDFDAESEKQALLSLQQMCVDGIIIASSGLNSELINQFVANGTPVVQFQLEYPNCQSSIVLSDYQQAAFQATEHLIEMGHQRICFVAQKSFNSDSRKARYEGYVQALNKHGMTENADLILYWDREKGFEQDPAQLLQQSVAPTAFFSQHLAITIELLQTFNRVNIEIPEQASVLGFDEIPMVELFKVPITVLRQDAHKIGSESAKLAIEFIEGKHETMQRTIVPCQLIKRDSVRDINRSN